MFSVNNFSPLLVLCPGKYSNGGVCAKFIFHLKRFFLADEVQLRLCQVLSCRRCDVQHQTWKGSFLSVNRLNETRPSIRKWRKVLRFRWIFNVMETSGNQEAEKNERWRGSRRPSCFSLLQHFPKVLIALLINSRLPCSIFYPKLKSYVIILLKMIDI